MFCTPVSVAILKTLSVIVRKQTTAEISKTTGRLEFFLLNLYSCRNDFKLPKVNEFAPALFLAKL